MGVKGLWTVLAPFCDRKPLYEIGGETVAVDLSGWVCDSQNVSEHHSQPKLYLRNLYFRTSYLLLYDVIPVFVLEGQAPEMKRKAMEARRQLQYTRTNRKQGKGGDISRKRFKNVLKQCENLLSSMGLQCVVGAGEAEAMCAHLNSTGLVSGVISQDSDCFVYGATRIYRNFSVGSGGAGSVDIYDLGRVQKSIDLGRNKMVALALLCGSDYNGTGVDGVGITSAISFLQQHSDVDIIPRLVSWNTDVEQYKEWERRVEDPSNCTACGHDGPLRVHTRQGCPKCATHKGCHSGNYKEWRLNMKVELQIRSKAMNSSEAFPDPGLLKEFLQHEEITPPRFSPSWGKPDLIKFTKLMTNWLGWSECYCLEKFLPLMTRWQLLHPQDSTLQPKTIVKKRNPRGVACYQVLWTDPQGLYDGLITDEQIAEGEINVEDLWTTVEKQELFQRVYPQLVDDFEASKVKKKKEKAAGKRKKQVTKDIDDNVVAEDGEKTDKVKRGKKRKAVGDVSFKTKSTDMKKKMEQVGTKIKGVQKTLHSFIAKNTVDGAVRKDGMSPLLRRKSHLFKDDVNKTADLLKNLSLDVFDDVDESDLSNIVENIVTRDNCIDFDVNIYFKNNLNNFSTPNGKCDNSLRDLDTKNKRISYFFGPLNDDYDAFENSIELKNAPDENLSISSNNNSIRKRKSEAKSVARRKNNKENLCGNIDHGLIVNSDNNKNKHHNLLRESVDRDANCCDNHVKTCDNHVKTCDNNVKKIDNHVKMCDNSVNVDHYEGSCDNHINNFKTRDSDVNFCDNGVNFCDYGIVKNCDKSVKVLSIEERLFGVGNNCADVACSTPTGNERVSRSNSSCSTTYTPLAERIRRLRDDL